MVITNRHQIKQYKPQSRGLWRQSVAMAAFRALETETTVR